MNINFTNIEYLEHGNSRQKQAYSALKNNQILSKLKRFDPILVGTIPINIDIETSDLDIICCFSDAQDFINAITYNFKNENNFKIREQQSSDTLAIVANFIVDNFEIEIFGQSIPTKQQFAYRHLIIEHNLLNKHGEKFRQQIIELKRQGYKTEPAFALALGLPGNPYMELLKFETTDQSQDRKFTPYFCDYNIVDIILPADRIEEDETKEWWIIGWPGVDGIQFRVRSKDPDQSVYAFYPMEKEYVKIAESDKDLIEKWKSGQVVL